MSAAEAPAQYNFGVIRAFAVMTVVWGIVGMLVGVVIAAQLAWPDVLPADDFGVRTGFRHAYRKRDLPRVQELLAFGERWRPYRTTAAWYLWCVADAASKKK